MHPPVDLQRFSSHPLEELGRGGYFLWLGALAPYKRVDLAVEAFRRVGAPLWIAGAGQEGDSLARRLPRNVKWLGPVPDEERVALYRDARALVFPGEEDFGLTPLEAQAAGRPVIALARGGVLETVTPDTGILFEPQTAEALTAAVRSFDAFESRFDPAAARRNAARFDKASFQKRFREQVDALLGEWPRVRA